MPVRSPHGRIDRPRRAELGGESPARGDFDGQRRFPTKVQILEDHLDRPVRHTTRTRCLNCSRRRGQPGSDRHLRPWAAARPPDRFLRSAVRRPGGFVRRRALSLPHLDPGSLPGAGSNYFRAFPHSLTFATHLREDLEVIDKFSQHAACDAHGLTTPPEFLCRDPGTALAGSVLPPVFSLWPTSRFPAGRWLPPRWAIASATKRST